jgi:hypothetical protein
MSAYVTYFIASSTPSFPNLPFWGGTIDRHPKQIIVPEKLNKVRKVFTYNKRAMPLRPDYDRVPPSNGEPDPTEVPAFGLPQKKLRSRGAPELFEGGATSAQGN